MKRCPHCDKSLEIPSTQEAKVICKQTERRVLTPIKYLTLFYELKSKVAGYPPGNPISTVNDWAEIDSFLKRMERNEIPAEKFIIQGMFLMQDDHVSSLVIKARYPWKYFATCIEQAIEEREQDEGKHKEEALRFTNRVKSLHKTN